VFAALCIFTKIETLKNLFLYIGAIICAAGGLVVTYNFCASVIRGKIDIGPKFKTATWSESKLYFLRLAAFQISVVAIYFIFMCVCLQHLGLILVKE